MLSEAIYRYLPAASNPLPVVVLSILPRRVTLTSECEGARAMNYTPDPDPLGTRFRWAAQHFETIKWAATALSCVGLGFLVAAIGLGL